MEPTQDSTQALKGPRLAPGDREDVEAVLNDRFQSPRARKRSKALLLLNEGTESVAVHMRTGLTLKNQEEMLVRHAKHGIHAAIFGSPRRMDQRCYDVKKIKKVISECLASRPPDGTIYWTLEELAAEIHQRVPGGETISRQSVATILRKEMGIRSIRTVEPYWLRRVKEAKVA